MGTKVSRGRSGPGLATNGSPDITTLLLSTVVPMISMMAHQATAAHNHTRRRPLSPASSLPMSSPQPSSPAPAIEDELDIFLSSFGRAKGISAVAIAEIGDRLAEAHYSPDALSEPTLTSEHLQKLTGLPEGQVYALRKFSRQWCGKVDIKRAKLKH